MSRKRKSKPSGKSTNQAPRKAALLTFAQVLGELLDDSKPFHPRNLYRFSDLEGQDLIDFQQAWPQVSTRRRQAILEDIEELGETNYTLSFEEVCRFTISDSDPRVRELSVRALSEYEGSNLISLFLNLLANDEDSAVRAASATALGTYVYLGEIEELPAKTLDKIVDRLLETYRSADTSLVRRRALESLGYSSRNEIPDIIESAFSTGKHDWMISAIFAMGRTANPRWGKTILEMLDSDDPELRYEAARAAGELELKPALTPLMNLLDDSDSDIRMAAVWSLSQIGGEGVQDALEQLYDETEDEDETDFIDLALENLMFTEDLEAFSLLELPPDGDEYDDEGYDFEDEFEDDLDEEEE
jgi:HEAT repeat protein